MGWKSIQSCHLFAKQLSLLHASESKENKTVYPNSEWPQGVRSERTGLTGVWHPPGPQAPFKRAGIVT